MMLLSRVRDDKPLILVAHEKHGDRYFCFTGEQELNKIALKLVKERAEYFPSIEKVEADLERWTERIIAGNPVAQLSEEDLAAVPEAIREQTAAEREEVLAKIKELRSEYRTDLALAKHVERLITASEEEALSMRVKNRDGSDGYLLATIILQAHSNYQYEKITLTEPEEF